MRIFWHLQKYALGILSLPTKIHQKKEAIDKTTSDIDLLYSDEYDINWKDDVFLPHISEKILQHSYAGFWQLHRSFSPFPAIGEMCLWIRLKGTGN